LDFSCREEVNSNKEKFLKILNNMLRKFSHYAIILIGEEIAKE